jgi:hypothetical protein
MIVLNASRPSRWLQLGSVLLPVLKCAVCPVCLGLFGTALAGARIGFLADERLHAYLILVALVADVAILGVSHRHHRRWAPILLCAAGTAALAAGHFGGEAITMEYAGFGLLMAASLWNMRLISRHRARGGPCCAHHATVHPG